MDVLELLFSYHCYISDTSRSQSKFYVEIAATYLVIN